MWQRKTRWVSPGPILLAASTDHGMNATAGQLKLGALSKTGQTLVEQEALLHVKRKEAMELVVKDERSALHFLKLS